MKFLDAINPAMALLGLIAGAIVFSFTTFATIDYVDKRHQDVLSRLDYLTRVEEQNQRLLVELLKKEQ